LIVRVAAWRAGGISLNKTPILILALLLIPALVIATPPAAAVACNPSFTGIYEIDHPEYTACVAGLGEINRLCHNCLA